MDADQKINILLVDDQPGKLLAYEAILAEIDANLIKASSGREALEHLLKNDISLVLMDVSMPELDGFELAEIIRGHPRFKKTAIIFVSAVHLTDLDKLKGYQSGAVDYVSVPVVPEILRAKVSVFTELYRRRRDSERLNLELEARVAERTAELEATTATLRSLTSKLQEADRRKDEFLADLAHELRNPLAPLRNALEILKWKPSPNDEVTWCREVMERQVEQLTRLVDDLLDISRITNGQILLQREPLELGAVATAAVETSRPLIDAGGHELAMNLPSEPIWVQGDRTRLTQIVSNLLNNAAKYQTPGGRVGLTLERTGDLALIRVDDHGVGIAPEALPRMFERHAEPHTHAGDPSQDGLGIGLSLVRKLVELHEGTVGARSAGSGKGSTFEVRLPCLREAPAQKAPDPQPLAARKAPGVSRILIVDDNRDAAETLASILGRLGHEVRVASDGPSALAIAFEANPSVVLLDIRMPGMDGYEVCRRMRAGGLTDAVMVAVTGFGQEHDMQRSLDAGCAVHMVKPVDVAELVGFLGRLSSMPQPSSGVMPPGSANASS